MAPSRPSTVVASVLAVLFVIACPQSVNVALSTLIWLMTSPAGVVLLGAALVVSLVYCAVTGSRLRLVRA